MRKSNQYKLINYELYIKSYLQKTKELFLLLDVHRIIFIKCLFQYEKSYPFERGKNRLLDRTPE